MSGFERSNAGIAFLGSLRRGAVRAFGVHRGAVGRGDAEAVLGGGFVDQQDGGGGEGERRAKAMRIRRSAAGLPRSRCAMSVCAVRAAVA